MLPATPFQALNVFHFVFAIFFLPMSSSKHSFFFFFACFKFKFGWVFFKVTFTAGTSRPISVYSNLQTRKME